MAGLVSQDRNEQVRLDTRQGAMIHRTQPQFRFQTAECRLHLRERPVQVHDLFLIPFHL